VIEIGLRIVGIGTSFDFFHEIEIDGQTYYQENPDFADQFYPPSLNIGPVENTFSKDRSSGLLRVYVLGGSAALGFPNKNHGFDRLLAAQLRAAFPSRQVEVINTAMTSVNSHVVYAVANSIPENSADFAVILMGNNEVVGPYGPGTFNQNFLASISLIRGIQALKRTRIWQSLDSILKAASPTDEKQELEWEGMQMFTNNGVAHNDPRMQSVYSHYKDNLASITETLRSKGMHVLLSSVPVNLRHSAPFLSVHAPGLSDDQLIQWRELTRSGSMAADEQRWSDAITQFQAALALDPEYADTHFRLATAYEKLGNHATARDHYRQALDLDALRFRADTRINQIIQAVAASYEGDAFSFVDSVATFEQSSQPFQPGWNLLLEHVHYDFSGNHLLAAEIARAIVSNVAANGDYQPLPAFDVARRVGFPNYDTIEEIKNLQGMIQHPPFPGQSNYAELKSFLDDKLEIVTNAIGSRATVVGKRLAVTERGLADWKVHFEIAVLYQRMRDRPAMYRHLNRIIELYPHNRESYMKLAEELSRDGRWQEVIPLLERSLHYTRGDESKIAETVNWLGTAYLRTGDYENARKRLLEVPQNHPDQIDLSLKAYANLVRYARERGEQKDLARYVKDVQRYARTLVRQGKDKEYPLLYERMAQIMRMGGYTAEAQEWADAKTRQ
jgi:tetratricopeptide (TPR) repeat protein